MSHASIRLLLHDVAKSLADNIEFGYGRKSEFNIIQGKSANQWIWLLPLTASGIFRTDPTRTKRWNVALLFLQHDPGDSNEEYSAHVLDAQDNLLSRYVHALNEYYEQSEDTFGAFTIENDTQDPFYKDNADVQTGWLLRFQMVVADDWDYCTPEIVQLHGDI